MNALEEKFRVYKNHRSEGNSIRMPRLKLKVRENVPSIYDT